MGDLPSREQLSAEMDQPGNPVVWSGGPILAAYADGTIGTLDQLLPVKGSERYEKAVTALREWAGDYSEDYWAETWSEALDAVLAALREEE